MKVKLYGEIAKSEDQDDGTVKVWGYASSSAVDSDGEQITPEAMKAALPDYMKFANVREMHTAKAAGVAIEAEVQEDGRTFFGAHIIDSEAVKKVKAKVYKGFSIGGKVTSRDSVNKSIINGLRLAEVSLVDRPANPEATFTFFKAEGLEADEKDVDPENPDADVKKTEAAPAPDPQPAPADEVVLKLSKAEADEYAAYKAKKKADERDALLKGMGHVAQLAYLLKEFQWLVADQQNEANREGDGSTVPAQLTAAVDQMGKILVQMTQEEVAELVQNITPAPDDATSIMAQDINWSDKTGDLAKAGAKFSASTKKTLGAVHEAMKTACAHLDGMNYADKADDHDDLAKVETLTSDLAKLAGERDELAKRVKELEALPAPTKATLKVVEKSQDHTDPLAKADEDPEKPMTPEQIMKSVHAKPMLMTAGGLRPLS